MLNLRTQISVALILAVASTAALAQRGGGFVQSNDPRVQNRTYHFADTKEDLPYCLFVSSIRCRRTRRRR